MATWVLLAGVVATAQTTVPTPPIQPFESAGPLTSDSPIDRLVLARLRQAGIEPAPLCSDAVFLRRAYLDVIGTIPTVPEAKDFLADRNPDKRAALIDRLLDRQEFADYWAMKWSDLLRIKAEFPIDLWPNAAQGYYRWIHTCIRDNQPYDRFVRELLTASGSNFRVPPVNFYRAVQSRQPEALAQAVALTFMGTRLDNPRVCSRQRLAGMSAFFARLGYKHTDEWKEEIIFWDSAKAPSSAPAVFLDGTAAQLGPDRDPREVFADWLIQPDNPWFARNIVNRIWCWLLGRGIIHEADDIRPDNPPANPELLAWLERELVARHYDLKQIYRLILNSKTYQRSCIARSVTADSANAQASFASYPLRRLEAEVLADALCQITGTTESYSSAIPEPFTFIPDGQRSIALPDGSITSAFLEMFGRPARDTGLESERNNHPTAEQCLHLLNSSHIQRKLEESRPLQLLWQSRGRGGNFRSIVTELYLMVLARYPTPEELRIAQEYWRSSPVQGRAVLLDLAWALINSPEFCYRH